MLKGLVLRTSVPVVRPGRRKLEIDGVGLPSSPVRLAVTGPLVVSIVAIKATRLLPVFCTTNRNEAVPGIGSTWTPSVKPAVRPEVILVWRLSWVLAVTAGLFCEVAVAVRVQGIPMRREAGGAGGDRHRRRRSRGQCHRGRTQAREHRRRTGQGEVKRVGDTARVGHHEIEGCADRARRLGSTKTLTPSATTRSLPTGDEPVTEGSVVRSGRDDKGERSSGPCRAPR